MKKSQYTARNHIRNAFFRRAGTDPTLLREMFDTLDNVTFNIIDSDDRIIAFSRSNCANCNFVREEDVIGRRCQELFPKVLSDVYVARNREVRTTGRPIVNRVYAHSADRSTDLKIVSIFPIRDRRGKVIGTTAIHRAKPSADKTPDWYGKVRRAVAYIDGHFNQPLSLADLAAEAGISPSAFSHAFKRITETSPANYITTIRINHARTLLRETDRTVVDIALACGFYDQSHFIRTFKKFRGLTPKQYRCAQASQENKIP